MNHQDEIRRTDELDPIDAIGDMSPEAMLALLVGDKADKARNKAEVTAEASRMMKIAGAKILDSALPPDDKLHEYWTVCHLGAGIEADPMISLWYTGVTFQDAEGNYYKKTIASGVCWLHQSIFNGTFSLCRAVQHAVDVGVIELHPPGVSPNPRTFSKDFRDNWASGALKLVTDSRTLKYVAKILGDRSGYHDALLLKANQLASEGK